MESVWKILVDASGAGGGSQEWQQINYMMCSIPRQEPLLSSPLFTDQVDKTTRNTEQWHRDNFLHLDDVIEMLC